MVKIHLYTEKEGTETGERDGGGAEGWCFGGYFFWKWVGFQIKKIFNLLITHPFR